MHITSLSLPIAGYTHLKFLLLKAGAPNFPQLMSPKRKVPPCCPRCIFQEQPVLRYTSTHTSPHQLAQLGKRLFRYLASLISLNVIFLSLSFKDVDIHFIRKNNSCENSKESVPLYSTLTMHFLRPCAFLT